MTTPGQRETPPHRARVAMSVDSEPLREQLTARLDDAGLEVAIISPDAADADDFPVIVTSARPEPAMSPNVVVYLRDNSAEISARLRTGQWLRLEDVDEVVGFVRELVLDPDDGDAVAAER